ncbi:MAG: AAA family ATPase, partial [Roseiflexaceae bacterium]
IYGQAELLHELQTRIAQKKCIVLTGEHGIGKTTVAAELAQRIVTTHSAKAIMIDCSAVDSIASFLRTIGSYYDINIEDTHDIQQRLEIYFSTSEYVVVLDNVNSKLIAIDGLYRIVKKMIARCVVIVISHTHEQIESREYSVHALIGLTHTTNDSPAVQLF